MLDRHLEPDEEDPFEEEEGDFDDEDDFRIDIAEYNYECSLFREPELKMLWRF